MERLVLLGLIGLGVACGSIGDDVQPCGEIPESGCPIGRGGTCKDTTCAALYDCVEGSWSLVERCDQNAGGGAGSGGAGAGGGAGGSGGCAPAHLDHTGETTGCAPDLQVPDCPAAAAETCSPCLTDCTDFFLCTTRGWIAVAYCDASGQLVVMQ